MKRKKAKAEVLEQYKKLAARIKDIKVFEGEITSELLKHRKEMEQIEQEYDIPSEIQFAVRV